ncbi:MAG: glycosyltransferase [Proteobacteria bacterium]|nr:glycosyltransferase [Pseudomonadota bacterium]
MKLTPDQRVPFVRSIARGNFDRARHIVRQSLAPREQAYSHWVELYDRLTDHDKAAIRKRIEVLPEKPLLSVLMPVYNPPVRYMRLAIDSVIAQLYPHWELCIADDKSSSPEVRKVLAHYASTDPRIKVTYRSENGHISACSNSALELVTGSFVVLMDQDDELPAHALYMIAEELNAHPDADVIYSDEDKIDADGQRFNPYFKPDWNSELFYSQNFVAHMGVYRTALVRQIGGFRIGYEGSQDYDLVLRILPLTSPDRIRHIPHVLYHWRRFPEAETFSSANPGRSIQSARQALEDYFAARQEAVDIVAITAFHWWRVKRAVPRPLPRVCVIIPTRDALGLLRNCLDGLLSRTDYDNLEIIIIDNESQDPETLAFLEQITTTQAAVRVLRVTGRFDFSMLNNRAAALTDADFLLFLNNDIEVMQPAWLTEMVSHGVQSDVGAVGAKLYYRHGTVQHAGVVLGIYGVASHGLRHRSHHDVGYFGRLSLAQDVSAATAACLLVRKRVFDEIGGYCERELAVGYGDVDLCLRIRHAGYRVVQSQFAELYHLESATRGDDLTREQRVRNLRERAFMRARWGSLLDNDPFYSPNLSLKTEDYDLAFPPRAVRPWRDVDAATAQYLRHEGLEFVCPFHRGDVLLGVQAAAAAVASGVSVRFHVAEPLLEWVEDFQPPFAVLPIPMQVPDAEGVQPGLHVARRYVERRADAAPFVVISHPSRSLKDTGGNLVPHMLDVLSAPVEPMANLMPVVPPARAQDVRRQLRTFGERVVLIHPAGGWALKSLPPDMTRRLIDLLHELGFQAVQIGGAGDAAIPEMDGHLLRNWSPASWRAAFAAAVAVAGVDSWSSHFAAILDVPQIVFYGPTNPVHVSSKRWFQHRDAPMLALGPVVGCSPCDSLTCTVYGDAVCRGFTLDPAAVRRFFSHLGTEPNRTVEAEALEADPHVLPQPRLLRC